MEQILNTYYADNAKKLHEVVDRILFKFGGISDKDQDDFYSLANEVFVDVMRRYDKTQSFDVFLYSCLSNKIKTEMTKRNRYKRKADRISISIDMPMEDDENYTLAEMIPDGFDIEKEIFGESEEGYSNKMLLYLNRLSETQKEVLQLIVAGYTPYEIKRSLHMSDKEYSDCNLAIHSYRNVSILF